MDLDYSFDLLGLGEVLNLTTLAGLLNTHPGRPSCSTPMPLLSPASSGSSSPGNDSISSCTSTTDIYVGLIPVDPLDYIRNVESFDFCTNGVDMELDEYDIYQASLRSAPIQYHVSKVHYVNPCQTRYLEFTKKRKTKSTTCVFCKNNGEPLSVYGTHMLKDPSGRVTCPILRRYTCPICGSSGDNAHTLKYCPLNANSGRGLLNCSN